MRSSTLPEKGVWLDNSWAPGAVITMWSTICRDLEPYLRTVTKGKNGTLNYKKSRRGQLAWRTFYNKLYENSANSLPSKYEASVAGSGRARNTIVKGLWS